MKRNLTELKRAIRPKTNSIRTTFLDLLEELTKSDQGRHFGSRGDEKHFRQLRRQAGAIDGSDPSRHSGPFATRPSPSRRGPAGPIIT